MTLLNLIITRGSSIHLLYTLNKVPDQVVGEDKPFHSNPVPESVGNYTEKPVVQKTPAVVSFCERGHPLAGERAAWPPPLCGAVPVY